MNNWIKSHGIGFGQGGPSMLASSYVKLVELLKGQYIQYGKPMLNAFVSIVQQVGALGSSVVEG